MKTQNEKSDNITGKVLVILLLITILLVMSALKCGAQSYRTVNKTTVQYDTIPIINKNISTIYMMEKRNFMIYKYKGCNEAIQVSKSIVDYMILCCELKCSCNLAILKRKKDGVLSRVIKYKANYDRPNQSEEDILNFKIYQK